MYKKLLFYAGIIIGIVIVYYLMTETWYEVRKAHSDASGYMPDIKMMILALLLGIFIEWNGLKNIIKGNFTINLLLIPTTILIIVVLIPSLYWQFKFGLGGPFYMQVLKTQELHLTLAVITGVLLVRSFSNAKNIS